MRLNVSNRVGLVVQAVQAGSSSSIIAGSTCAHLTPPARLWQRRAMNDLLAQRHSDT
jgi:hypothetical protein